MANISTVNSSNNEWTELDAGLTAVGVYKNKTLTTLAEKIDEKFNGVFQNAIKLGDVKGKVEETHLFYLGDKRVLLIGLGDEEKINTESIRTVSGKVSRFAIDKKISSVAIECFCEIEGSCQAMGEGLVLGSYQFLNHKTDKENLFQLEKATVLNSKSDEVEKGAIIGNAVCSARDLSNHPGNIATPSHLAEFAAEIAAEGDMKLTVFERDEFTKMGMGALAGVAQGSDEPPKFIVLEYMNGGDQKPKVLVGKGLTFDAGGISIKPSASMDEMKYDMCGSATVLGVFKALASLKPSINAVCIVPSTENLVGAKAYKPGDVLKAYNGKTIEVLNTDAEGRLILADALSYASKHYDPEYILDFATLTGAVLISLGHIATGVMGNNDELMSQIKGSSKKSSEKVWEFPLWPEFIKQVKSEIADVKNLGSARQAGSIAGGAFLSAFVGKDIPWTHFDIAGTAWGGTPNSINPKGSATGWGVRLVLDLMKL
jgi:leucyl aminopeptidase